MVENAFDKIQLIHDKKRYTEWEGRNKMVFCFMDDVIIYVKNIKELRKNMELVSRYSIVAVTRLIYKSKLLSYIPAIK